MTVLKANSFLYPTINERINVRELIPEIKRLNFEYESALIKILRNSTPDIENAINQEDIYWWNDCLNNRIGKLKKTCTYVFVHHNRMLNYTENTDTEFTTDEFLFNYYIEIFYYYYFSVRDILAQLLNNLFGLNYKENKIYFNENFISKIPNKSIQEALNIFKINTEKSYVIRNSFNHRFTPNYTDNRAKENISRKDRFIEMKYADEINDNDFVSDVKELMSHLGNLMGEISFTVKK